MSDLQTSPVSQNGKKGGGRKMHLFDTVIQSAGLKNEEMGSHKFLQLQVYSNPRLVTS